MLQDLKYAVRSFFRQPAFAFTAILTLAIGVGATTAIFSVVNAVILRPLQFEDPERIVAVQNYWTQRGQRTQNLSAPDFHDIKAQAQSFEAVGYYSGGEWSATINGAADYVLAFRVTPGFLEALRAKPTIGRLLSEEEQRPGGPLALVITDGFWNRQFNRDPAAVGSTVKFDERIFTIVGVLPPEIRFPARTDFYYPAWAEEETKSRSGHNYRAIARLRDGVTIEQARGELSAIASRLEQMYPDSNTGKQFTVVPLQEVLLGGIKQTIWVLFAAVGVILVIACANVANLLLARSSIRAREMVVRAAVGASRWRLVRQLLTESAVLGLTAALIGAWLARLGIRALVAIAPVTLPRIGEVDVDLVALGFAIAIALAASFIFGLAPALQVSRVQLVDGLRQGGKGSSVGSRTGMARSAFVVAEIALAVVLVAGAGLLARSLAALTSVDMGFEPEQLLVVRTAVPTAASADAPRATAFYRDLLQDVRMTPGVQAASAARSIPTQASSFGSYAVEGRAAAAVTNVGAPGAVLNVVAPDYFRTIRVAVRRGRDFNDGDRMGAPMVAIINEALARAAFGDVDPLGHRIQCGLDTLEFMTIVGVVADVRTAGPATPAQPEIYMPYEQHPMPSTALTLVIRAASEDPLTLTETIRRKVSARNPDVPIKATTMMGTLETAAETPRFRTFLLVVFAAVALVLAVAGVYGVMAYTVNQRIPELGVRVALGATPGNILGLVVRQGAKLAAIGLALGLALALVSGKMLEGLLFGVTARDPIILALVTIGVAVVTMAACYIPSRRAARVDPMIAVRAE